MTRKKGVTRTPRTKEMLLPLSIGKVQALSLENHLAFATVRAGRGDSEQIINLLRVIYLAFFLREQTASGADLELYRRAEAAVDACIDRAEQAERWLLLDHGMKVGLTGSGCTLREARSQRVWVVEASEVRRKARRVRVSQRGWRAI